MTAIDPPALRRPNVFPLILTALFLTMVLIQASRHVMWRDELRTWQIASECTGPISLIHAMRFDSVPILWNLIVFLLTRISSNAILMQITHAFIAAGVVYVVARWAPFSRLSKVLFAFGYFPFFEYAVIARSYSLVFLFMMIACALISRPRVPILMLSGVLLLLSQVSLWSAGFAVLFLLAGLVKIYGVQPISLREIRKVVLSGSIVLAGVVLCMFQMFPGPGPTFVASWANIGMPERLWITIATIYRGLVPIPQWDWHFWNFNILDPHYAVQAALGLLLFGLFVVMLIRRPLAAGVFIIGTLALVIFSGVMFRGSTRHHGQIFMLLIAAFWLAEASPAWGQLFKPTDRLCGLQLAILLGVNAIAGIGAAAAGLVLPFSATYETGRHIRSNFDDRVLLAAYLDFCAAPIAYWLDKPIYSPQEHKYARITTQDDSVRIAHPNLLEIFSELYDLSLQNGNKDVLLILNAGTAGDDRIQLGDGRTIRLMELSKGYFLTIPFEHKPHGLQREVDVRFVAAFVESVVADEQQWLYRLTFKK